MDDNRKNPIARAWRRLRRRAKPPERRRARENIGKAIDVVSLSVAIWLGLLVMAESAHRIGEMSAQPGGNPGQVIAMKTVPAPGFGG